MAKNYRGFILKTWTSQQEIVERDWYGGREPTGCYETLSGVTIISPKTGKECYVKTLPEAKAAVDLLLDGKAAASKARVRIKSLEKRLCKERVSKEKKLKAVERKFAQMEASIEKEIRNLKTKLLPEFR